MTAPVAELHEARVPVTSEGDIVTARQTGRSMAAALGFDDTDQTLIATAISEITRNMLTYGGGGETRLAVVEGSGGPGLRIEAIDQGPGIADVDRAMEDGYSTGNSLGIGLPGARRLMDEFEIDSAPGKGTRVSMVKWVRSKGVATW